MKNLAADPNYEATRKLLERMETLLREEGDPRMLGNAKFFDTIRYTGPRKHGWESWLKNNQNPE